MSGIIGSAGSKSGLLGQTEIYYETGTWTPRLHGAGTPLTHSTQIGFYTRIGDRVFVNGQLATSSLGSASGGATIEIDGIPFKSGATTGNYAGGNIGYANGLNITAGNTVGLSVQYNSVNTIFPIWSHSGGTGTMACSEWSADGNMRFNYEYQTDGVLG